MHNILITPDSAIIKAQIEHCININNEMPLNQIRFFCTVLTFFSLLIIDTQIIYSHVKISIILSKLNK